MMRRLILDCSTFSLRFLAVGSAVFFLCVGYPWTEAVAESAKGLPQLNPGYFTPQIFWLVVSFLALYLFMAFVGVPRIERVLEKRQQTIKLALDAAMAARNAAVGTVDRYTSSVADLRRQAQVLIASAESEAATAAETRLKGQMAALNSKAQEAKEKLAEAHKKAASQIQDSAVDIVEDLLRKMTGQGGVSRENIVKILQKIDKHG